LPWDDQAAPQKGYSSYSDDYAGEQGGSGGGSGGGGGGRFNMGGMLAGLRGSPPPPYQKEGGNGANGGGYSQPQQGMDGRKNRFSFMGKIKGLGKKGK